MSANDSPPSPQARTKRWLWRLGLVFLLLLAVLAAAFAIWRANLSKKIARTLATLQSAGYPTTLAELEKKYYPVISPDKNAAPFFQNAFAGLHETNDSMRDIPLLPDYQSTNQSKFYSQTNLELIAKLLADNRKALELLHQSPPATNCRYPVNLSKLFDVLLPHLRPLKDSAQLLSLEAVIHARNGDPAASVDDLTAILRLVHSLDREPILISQLTRLSAEALAIKGLEHVLNSQPLSDPQLVRLSAAFRDLENSSAMERAVAGELCTGADTFQMFVAEVNKVARMDDSGGANGPSPPALNAGYRFVKLTGFFSRDYCFYLETMAENLRIARLSPTEKLNAASKLGKHVEQEITHHYYPVSSLIIPSLKRAYARQIETDARLNLVQTVLAIERYRLAHQNRLPDQLSDLVPSFVNAVPADPFDGKPLRYKKLAKGYLVYSVGEDGKDDGGVYAPQAKPGAPSDLTFIVER